ncbi:MAG: TonB-dependent receptor [Candidatus Marinimicrobia bacterium]|jgi:iron complex outermembrane recepter protein|nr:TonB-dependent receptor [Candidatus Neomarinimicrobiota bacterium]MBT4360434.1 TonB-dependent receptor [Candidatus Neomarinimicrobiota bacterium]MBT4715511.1 TonB-dependent receptor [Candidatus Neomarinimicrobiota bacterium]MBT4947281.1 TonB-dependent receptor [Candidatus Neomarinimicrobiota bacterium]MBT5270731.1 TonB-dependent receptor [Candidatus Neomarinimicrobiota bacterium]
MHRFTTLLISILILNSVSLAQDTNISGSVVDATTKLPIVGCQIISGSMGTITDDSGNYSISGSLDNQVIFQHIAYDRVSLNTAEVPETIELIPNLLRGETVSVYGALRTQSLLESEGGISVISKREISRSSEPHFQTLINHIPNLNWAGGSSRPRYFQIRGIGERSQFAGDGPPNYSVGFSIDDLDLSGIGMSGLTFDVNRVELFRGPQSSIYGPNALAGFIVLRSNDPGQYQDGYVTVSAGNANTLNIGTALNLLSGSNLKARLAAYRGYNNGFMYNQYLDDHTTNERTETMGRLKLIWSIRPKLEIKATLLTVNLDNGYDTWSPDNSAFTTYSDKPGKDSQTLNAAVLKAEYALASQTDLYSITSLSRADMEYSYDSDWGNDEFWANDPYSFDPAVEGWSYDFFDKVARVRNTRTQELRLVHANKNESIHVIAGAYYKDLNEQDDAEGYLFGGDESELESEFHLRNRSAYAQIDFSPIDKITLTSNLRIGNRDTDYEDNKTTAFSLNDQLNGGKIAILYKIDFRKTAFINAARGFKAGGINQHPRILDINRPFSPEYVNNYEIGFRGVSNRGMLSLLAFYTQRMDQQVSLSSQQDPMDPNSFTYYIGNASEGYVYGIELEFRRDIFSRLHLSGTLGLLESKTQEYSFEVAPDQFVTLGDRAFAHAPRYSFRIGIDYNITPHVSLRSSIAGKDKFYFSESHDQVSEPYNLVNSGITYAFSISIEVSFWVDNLLDTQHAVRGFYFGLEPPNYSEKLYMSYGDPRHFGLTLKYKFGL